MAREPQPVPTPAPGRGSMLAAVIGSIGAAASLFVLVPAEESGRKVSAKVQDDGSIAVKHVGGKQYLTAYLDIVKVPTICDGITKGVRLGMTRTPEQCAALLEQELIAHARPLIRCMPKLYGREHQVIAAVSLSYNIGTAGVCRSSVAQLWNDGKWRAGCERFRLFNKATGSAAWARKQERSGERCAAKGKKFICTVKGLTMRRERERMVCLQDLPV